MRPLRRRPSFVSVLQDRRGENALGALGAGGLVLVLLLAAVCYIAFAWFPAWWDYLAMREITLTVSREFAEHSEIEKSKAYFSSQLKAKDVSEDISVESCMFADVQGSLNLDCNWTTWAYYPGTDYYKSFAGSLFTTPEGTEGTFGFE